MFGIQAPWSRQLREEFAWREEKIVEGPSKNLDLIRTTNFTVGRTVTFSSSLEVSVGCSLWRKLATFLFQLKLEFLLQLWCRSLTRFLGIRNKQVRTSYLVVFLTRAHGSACGRKTNLRVYEELWNFVCRSIVSRASIRCAKAELNFCKPIIHFSRYVLHFRGF